MPFTPPEPPIVPSESTEPPALTTPAPPPEVGFASPWAPADAENRDRILDWWRMWFRRTFMPWTAEWSAYWAEQWSAVVTYLNTWLASAGDYISANAVPGPPGPNTVPTDLAIANAIDNPNSATSGSLNQTYSRHTPSRTFLVIGDSLVSGNQDGSGVSIPSLLAAALPDYTVVNGGLAGYASADIAAAYGVPFVFAETTIPGAVTEIPLTLVAPVGGFRQNAPLTLQWSGKFTSPSGEAVPGTLRHYITGGADNWTFTRAAAGDPAVGYTGFVSTQFDAYRAATLIIQLGRNNFEERDNIIRDISAIIALNHVSANTHLVGNISTTTDEVLGTWQYREVHSTNEAIAAAFPQNYVGWLSTAVDRVLALNNTTPTTADLWQNLDDTLPASAMFDSTHPNHKGYRAISDTILGEIRKRGQLQGVSNPISGVNHLNPAFIQWVASDLGPINAAGRGITHWRDRIAGRYLEAPGTTPTLAYRDGRAYVQFDGVADWLSFALPVNYAQPFTVIAFCRIRTLDAKRHGIVWSGGSPGSACYVESTGAFALTGGVSTAAGAVPEDTDVVVGATFNGASNSLAMRVGIAATSGNGGTVGILTDLRIGYAFNGVSQYANLDLYEVRVYPGALIEAQIARVATEMTNS